jgi:ornithine carbamoyltransferase
MMNTKMRGKHFVSLMKYSPEEIETILETGFDLKKKLARGEPHPLLAGKTLGMLFCNPSTRTRVSFETGMTQLGGHAQYYAPEQLAMKHEETWEDTARVISRYLDAIMLRVYALPRYGMAREIMMKVANNATVPVINALDDKEHPCQVMADIMTIVEKFGPEYKRKKVVLAWVCSKRVGKSPGIPHDMAIVAGALGMNLTIAYPDERYDLDEEFMAHARELAKKSGANIEIVHDLTKAAKDSDILYAKCWGGLRMESQEDIAAREHLRDWCLAKKHFNLANPNAMFMHSLPVERNQEALNEVIDGPMSIIYDQAENRLHAQKAVMALIMR